MVPLEENRVVEIVADRGGITVFCLISAPGTFEIRNTVSVGS